MSKSILTQYRDKLTNDEVFTLLIKTKQYEQLKSLFKLDDLKTQLHATEIITDKLSKFQKENICVICYNDTNQHVFLDPCCHTVPVCETCNDNFTNNNKCCYCRQIINSTKKTFVM